MSIYEDGDSASTSASKNQALLSSSSTTKAQLSNKMDNSEGALEEGNNFPPEESPSLQHKRHQIKNVILQVCLFVLVTELCERLAYYGLTGSLPVFFSKVFKLNKALSTEINTLFGAVNYVTPLLGAFIADKYIGRFRTIGWFCVLYIIGMLLCVMGAVPSWSNFAQPLFFVGLFGGVAVGAGGIKPNVVVLGADQFDLSNEDGRAQKDRFFNYFYWCINIGAAVAFGVLTNVAVNGIPPDIPEQWGFFVSFLIPAIAMCIAVGTFFAGYKRIRCCGRCYMGGYITIAPNSSALGKFLIMFGRAAQNTRAGQLIIGALLSLVIGFVSTICSYFIPETESNTTSPNAIDVDAHFIMAVVGMVCIIFSCVVLILVGNQADWMHTGYRMWLDKQKRQRTSGKSVSAHSRALVETGVPISTYGTVTGASTASIPADIKQKITQPTIDDPTKSETIETDVLQEKAHSVKYKDDSVAPSIDDEDLVLQNQHLMDACEVVRLLPYFAYIVVFWAVYGQMSNNFILQGCQMNLFWTGNPQDGTAQVSSAFLNLFDTVVILAFIPIFDSGIYPCIAKLRNGRGLTVLEKVGSGFFFCTLSMIVAGVVEILRKESGEFAVDACCVYSDNQTQLDACCGTNSTCTDSCAFNSNCASEGTIENMSRLSVWWQAFQFLLIGIAEILTSVSSYELFYTQVPESMRSICQALNLLTTSIGFMVTGGINSVFQFWIPNNLNNGRLENVYFFIGALSLIAGLGYIFTARSFVYSDQLRINLMGSVHETGDQQNSGNRNASLSTSLEYAYRSKNTSLRSDVTSDVGIRRRESRAASIRSHHSSMSSTRNVRDRRMSTRMNVSLRSRSHSQNTFAVTGLTCASDSHEIARNLSLVPVIDRSSDIVDGGFDKAERDSTMNSKGLSAPTLPPMRSSWNVRPSTPSTSTATSSAEANFVSYNSTNLLAAGGESASI